MNRRSNLLFLLITTLMLLLFRTSGVGSAPKPITLESLLWEMVDRDAVAKRPAPAYVLKQVSSHDILKRDAGDPVTWHSNHDAEQFLRTEMIDGRREWVIMDDAGPGAITRFWLPLEPGHDNQIIRFYFDGAQKPSIAVKFNDLLSGRALVAPPFAFVAWNDTDVAHQKTAPPKELRGVAGDLYLPIPFARHCKITLDQLPFYYIINYRAYPSGTPVRTFSLDEFQAAHATLEQVGQRLTATTPFAAEQAAPPPAKQAETQATLAPGAETTLDLPTGTRAVRELRVEIDPKDAPQGLRSTVLTANFDDAPAIWCPLSEFFGTGPRLHAVHDWNRTVEETGRLSARFVMPYQHSGRFALKNVGDKAMTVKLSAVTTSWHWDNRSLYFHANWRCSLDMKTRPFSDWNYIAIQGEGQYVGDTLSVFTPVGEWYGEGDERVYVDGETFPSHIGTGTEDYYGYAWGMASYFNSPFLSTPLRDTPDRNDWRGYTTTSRLRLLDGIPMQTGLKLDMEIWNWSDTKVDYAVGTFWYARPGATHNRLPQPQEAAMPVRPAPKPPVVMTIPGAVECEEMHIAAISPGTPTGIQNGGLRQGSWSGGKQLFVQATRTGDYIELEIPVPDKQPRKVTLYGTRSFDYAVLRFHLNGQPAGTDTDTYAAEPTATGPIELGTATPKDGKLLLRVEVAGANPVAPLNKRYFGLDCVVLQK